MFTNLFPENHAVYEIMLKNVIEPEKLHMTIWWCGAYWIIRATRVHKHTAVCVHAHTRTKYILLFHCNSGFLNASQCYIIHALPVLLKLLTALSFYLCVTVLHKL
jgi:hypothetical protein